MARPVLDFISCEDLAKGFGISLKTLKRMDAAGKLPPKVQISARKGGYRLSACNALFAELEKIGTVHA